MVHRENFLKAKKSRKHWREQHRAVTPDPNTPSMNKFRPGNVRTPTSDFYRGKLPQDKVSTVDLPVDALYPG